MVSLIERIGSRTVMIDENLPLTLAKALREKGLSVRHVKEMHLPMSDSHIQIQMYETDVLLTRDRHFRFKLGKSRAILIKSDKSIDALLAMVG